MCLFNSPPTPKATSIPTPGDVRSKSAGRRALLSLRSRKGMGASFKNEGDGVPMAGGIGTKTLLGT